MDTPSSNTAASSPAPINGAKETVSSPSLGTAASSWATVASRGSKNKLRRRAAAARGFQPVTGEQGFEYTLDQFLGYAARFMLIRKVALRAT
ncbi:hypothetical protein G6F62_013121 [Rhizopus arrhizus]|nr:hypothetical protein G6F17_012669 [Rhizopus arrhizus]KAG0931911.1 hypothetical protein G6F31_016668 [Rhizopus arrhizus]KAG1023548.1 hypothetical protein G6F25_013047 [Rhizopus arrhizus]KAG1267233.1 hypothetical protein G6F65_013946 [Rhizopus arrhizus]KAG1317045.1 hypothetical protein G6F62_013121 [Rhizopus arrhizus]